MAPQEVPQAQDRPETGARDELFDELFRQHYRRLVRFFGRRGLDPELSRDLAQDSLLRAFEGLADLGGRRPPASWVTTIAANVWRNWVRDHRGTLKRGRPEHSLEAAADAGFEPGESEALWPSSRPSDPEAAVIRRQAVERMRALLHVLTPREREAFAPWLEGASYREIATRLDTTLSNVKSALYTAKGRIVAAVRETSGPQEDDDGARGK